MHALIPILCTGVLLCGCQSSSKLDSGDFDEFLQRAESSKKQSGDFGAFFVQQIARYGGQAISSPPKLEGRWYFESDHDGFAVQLYDTRFSHVQAILAQAYGPPRSIHTNLFDSRTGLYSVREIGVGIQFFGNTKGVGFVCLEKQKK